MIERDESFGGRVGFASYPDLEEAYRSEKVYPLDLKNGVANQLNKVSHMTRAHVMWPPSALLP